MPRMLATEFQKMNYGVGGCISGSGPDNEPEADPTPTSSQIAVSEFELPVEPGQFMEASHPLGDRANQDVGSVGEMTQFVSRVVLSHAMGR